MAVKPSFFWLFVIFLAIYIFSSLPLLSEGVNDFHTFITINSRRSEVGLVNFLMAMSPFISELLFWRLIKYFEKKTLVLMYLLP